MSHSPSQLVTIVTFLVVVVAITLARLLPNHPDLLAELADKQFAWGSSTTDVPISTVSVFAKDLLSSYRRPSESESSNGQSCETDEKCSSLHHPKLGDVYDIVPTGDTLKIKPVRDRLNKERFEKIRQLCDINYANVKARWLKKLILYSRKLLSYVIGEKSCDFNQVDTEFGLTPLHLAYSVDDQPLIDFLLRNGANPIEDHVGRLPRNLSYTNFISNSKRFSKSDECDIPSVDFTTASSTSDIKFAKSEVGRLIREGEPILMRGAYTYYNSGPEWNVDDFLSNFGDIDVRVGSVPYADAFNLTTTKMKLSEFYNRFVSGNEGENSYVFNKHPEVSKNAYNVLCSLIEDSFPLQKLLIHPNSTGHLDGIHFFFGRKSTGAPFHIHADAVNAAINGRKKWFIYTPSRTIYSRKTIYKWVNEDLGQLQEDEKPLQCVQHPGDVIYVPLDWGHAVLNLDDNTFGVALELLNRRDTFAHLTGHA